MTENPYRLTRDVRGIGFKTADAIAMRLGFEKTAMIRLRKAIILKGPWPWAHDFVMETKEHLIFIPLILAILLSILTTKNLAYNAGARKVAVVVATFFILNVLAIEAAGAIINHSVKIAFVQPGVKGTE
jgi:hypothetical protein